MNAITKFVTCSADRTVRFWNFVDPCASLNPSHLNKVLVKNAYSKDMSRMIYVNCESRDEFGNLTSTSSQQTSFL